MLLRPITYEFEINGEKYQCDVQTLFWSPKSKIPAYKLQAEIFKKHGHVLCPVEMRRERRMTWKEFAVRILEILRTKI